MSVKETQDNEDKTSSHEGRPVNTPYRVRVYGISTTMPEHKLLFVTCYGPKAVLYAVNKLAECYPEARIVITHS